MQSMSSRSLAYNGDNWLAQEVWRTEPAKLNYQVNFLNMSVGFHHTSTCTFFFFFIFKFYFIFKLYNIVLVLPNINMNPPQVYMWSPS